MVKNLKRDHREALLKEKGPPSASIQSLKGDFPQKFMLDCVLGIIPIINHGTNSKDMCLQGLNLAQQLLPSLGSTRALKT